MVNSVNINNNGYQVSNAGIKPEQLQSTLAGAKNVAADNFESNSAIKAVSDNDPEQMKKVILALPFLSVLDEMWDKAMGGKEGKGILNNAAKIGDKISDTLHLGNTGKRISGFIENNLFTKYFTKKYAAVPKSSFALGEFTQNTSQYTDKLFSALEDLKHNPECFKYLEGGTEELSSKALDFIKKTGPLKKGLTPEYLSEVKGALGELASKLPDEAEKNALKALGEAIDGFSTSGASSTKKLSQRIADILSAYTSVEGLAPDAEKAKIISGLSDKTKQVLDSINTSSLKTTEGLTEVIDELVEKGVKTGSKEGFFKKPVDLSVINNKLKATESKIGKTELGQKFAKGALKAKNLLTMNGGLLGLAFTASAVIKAAKAAKEAPEGEKTSTFMHVMSENYLGLALFGPGIKSLYMAGGNKYRGMTVEGREALKKLVHDTNANSALTKEGFKIAQLQKKLLLKGVNKDEVAKLSGKSLTEAKNLFKSLKGSGAELKAWEKPLKSLGNVLDTGLDTLKNPSMAGKIKNKLKGFGGGFMRFTLIMFVIQPFIQKPLTKLVHKIFGEPTDYLRKQEAANNANNANPSSGDANSAYTDRPWTSLPGDVVQQPQQFQQPLPQQQVQPGMMPAAQASGQPYIPQYTMPQQLQQPLPQQQVQPGMMPAAQASGQPYIPQYTMPQQLQQPGMPAQMPQASTPLNPDNSAIPALNLFHKDDDAQGYIPSINVDFAQNDKEAEIQRRVKDILKSTDAVMAETRKVI